MLQSNAANWDDGERGREEEGERGRGGEGERTAQFSPYLFLG
jgi:hypothetical protein